MKEKSLEESINAICDLWYKNFNIKKFIVKLDYETFRRMLREHDVNSNHYDSFVVFTSFCKLTIHKDFSLSSPFIVIMEDKS